MTLEKEPHPVDIHVGVRLRQQRCYAGLTQTALAEAVGITFQQLQKYENAVNRVSASRLWELAAELNAPVEFFFPVTEAAVEAWEGDPLFLRCMRIYRGLPRAKRIMLVRLAELVAEEGR